MQGHKPHSSPTTGLEWATRRQIDLAKGTIDLEPGSTKNDDARLVRMTEVVRELLKACIAGKGPDDLVFTRNGNPIGDFRKTWTSCCKVAGIPGTLLFHDLRRSGARNMRRMGVGEQTIMRIAGMKTPSIFSRYNIVDQSDLEDAARRMDERNAKMRGQKLGAEKRVAKSRKSVQNEVRHSLGIVKGKRNKVVNAQLPN